jgi:hypothetical protein
MITFIWSTTRNPKFLSCRVPHKDEKLLSGQLIYRDTFKKEQGDFMWRKIFFVNDEYTERAKYLLEQ